MMSVDSKGGVGYKRPPREHCWKKGQSGNPKGRPPGHRNLSAAITAVINEQVGVAVDGEERQITRLESVVRQLVARAEAGDPRAMQQLIAEIHKNEAKAEREASAQPLAEADRQALDALYVRLAREAAAAKNEREKPLLLLVMAGSWPRPHVAGPLSRPSMNTMQKTGAT